MCQFEISVRIRLNSALIVCCLKGGLQLNFGGIGVELRMKERRIEEGIHVNQLVR